MIDKTGIPTKKDIEKILPPNNRLDRGACVILECFQKIPCDPCVTICPQGAIKIEGNINNLPKVDYEKCTGCGICVSECPGLAIFVVDKNYAPNYGLIMLPYEFFPLPKKGDIVLGLSREGREICKAKVIRVLLTKKQNRTAIISIQVPKDLIMEVRNIRLYKT
jgi:Fe-S-cluster-containing hydrogenase component 2